MSPVPALHGLSPPTAAGAGVAHKVVLAITLCVGLAACVEKGDFGRPRPGAWNDVVLPYAGTTSARLRGEAVSSFPFTDAEFELRNRSWRFLMPAHERSNFDALVANLVRTRVLPPWMKVDDETAYYRSLMSVRARSPASSFRRIGEDALADAGLIAPFADVAGEVLAADERRLRALSFVEEVTAREVAQAVARVAENRCLIAWVRDEVGQRSKSYSYAVQHGFVAMPQTEAVEVERAVAALEAQRPALAALPAGAWRDGTCLKPALRLEGRRAVIVKG